MRSTLKFLGVLVAALIAMLVFRTLVFTVYTVPGQGLEPVFLQGDRVMVNRWSYGLRTGGEGLFAYGRILRQPVGRGDLVALNDSDGQVLICRCAAVPGDSISVRTHRQGGSTKMIVPGTVNCADQDYYWMQSLSGECRTESVEFATALVSSASGSPVGNSKLYTRNSKLVPEKRIIGRVCLIVYNHADSQPFWQGYRHDRWFIYP